MLFLFVTEERLSEPAVVASTASPQEQESEDNILGIPARLVFLLVGGVVFVIGSILWCAFDLPCETGRFGYLS